jgi:putative membrane protein
MHWHTWWHAGGMWLFWFAVIAVVSLSICLAARSMRNAEPPRETPDEILKKRFARGEIGRDEYERAMRDLGQFQ